MGKALVGVQHLKIAYEKSIMYVWRSDQREVGELLYLILKMAKVDALFAGSADDQKMLVYLLWKILYHFYLL